MARGIVAVRDARLRGPGRFRRGGIGNGCIDLTSFHNEGRVPAILPQRLSRVRRGARGAFITIGELQKHGQQETAQHQAVDDKGKHTHAIEQFEEVVDAQVGTHTG